MRIVNALVSTIVLFGFLFPQAMAAQPGAHLNIEEVAVTVDDPYTTLVISGTDFEFGSPLEVTLAGAPATITGSSDTEITATVLTASFPDGDYLLNVSTGNGQSQDDEYDLTIGAAGPQGIQGIQGEHGETGGTGAAGADGDDGAAGTDGDDGAAGTDGDDGADGADGDDGADGAVGPTGADGADGADGDDGAAGADGADVTNELCQLYQLTEFSPPSSLACQLGACIVDADCPDNNWCRETGSGFERECVAFLQEGEFCGGRVVGPEFVTRCQPDLFCVDETPFLADDPGVCRTEPAPPLECVAGQSETQSCGNGGSQIRNCQFDGTWGPFGTCTGESP